MTLTIKNIEASDIYKAIEKLPVVGGSYTNLENDSPSLLIAHEIQKYSAKKLEKISDQRGRGNIFYLCINKKNHFLLGLLLEKGAFHDHLFECSRYLVENHKDMTLMNYHNFLCIEMAGREYNRDKNVDPKSRDFFSRFENIMENIPADVQDKFLDKYIKQYKEDIVFYIHNYTYKENAHILKRVMNKFKEHNITLTINDLLPPDENNRKFFVPDYITSKIEKLLNLGFILDDSSYMFNNETLLNNILKSKNAKLLKVLLPHIKNVLPLNMSLEEQTKLLDDFKDNKYYNEIKTTYNFIVFSHSVKNKSATMLKDNKNKI